MDRELPKFKYNPFLKADVNFPFEMFTEEEAEECPCCGKKSKYWVMGMYSRYDIDMICPWCVADGSAAEKYDASFVQDIETHDGLSQEIIDELLKRTIGYSSWQGENWLVHCNDGCEFHGQAKAEDLKKLSKEDVWYNYVVERETC